jgi:peptide deformylase
VLFVDLVSDELSLNEELKDHGFHRDDVHSQR